MIRLLIFLVLIFFHCLLKMDKRKRKSLRKNLSKKIKLSKKLFYIVKKIPKGKVMTYKRLAHLLEISPRAAAKILSKNEKPIKVPCHRVIRSDGSLGGYTYKGKSQKEKKAILLKAEGVKIKNNKIDLSEFEFIP